jgi:hypothetical protein
LGTRFTADTSAAVEIDNAVFSVKKRRYRTDLDTRSVSAVVAPHYGKQPACIGKSSLFDVFDPGAVYSDRHFVLGLARDGTRMAADTLSVIDNEAKIHNGTT